MYTVNAYQPAVFYGGQETYRTKAAAIQEARSWRNAKFKQYNQKTGGRNRLIKQNRGRECFEVLDRAGNIVFQTVVLKKEN